MKVFGFYNNCYWMMLSSIEEVRENLNPFILSRSKEYIVNSLKEGKFIWVNEAGGFHASDIEDKKDLIALNDFPTNEHRETYLQAKLKLISCEFLNDDSFVENCEFYFGGRGKV